METQLCASEVTFHNILSLSIVEDRLSKNFMLLFKSIEDKAARLKDLEVQFEKRIEMLEGRLNDQMCKQKSLNDKVADKLQHMEEEVCDMIHFRMEQEERNTKYSDGLNELRIQLIQLNKGRKSHEDRLQDLTGSADKVQRRVQKLEGGKQIMELELQKKAERTDISKLKKEVSNLFVKLESEGPKIKDLQQKFRIMLDKVDDFGLQVETFAHREEDYVGAYERSIETQQVDSSIVSSLEQASRRKPTLRDLPRNNKRIQDLESKIGFLEDQFLKLKGVLKDQGDRQQEDSRRLEWIDSEMGRESQEWRQCQSELVEKIAILGVGFNQNQFRFDLIQEETGLLKKHFEKVKAESDGLLLWVRELNLKRIGQQIKAVQLQQNLLSKEVEDKLDKKVDSAELKLHLQVNEKAFKALEDELRTKSDRLSVKKALAFFQNKLKEIVLVMNSKESTQTDSLISRKGYFCLSCDKLIPEFKGQQNVESERRKGFRGSSGLPKSMLGQSLRRHDTQLNQEGSLTGRELPKV